MRSLIDVSLNASLGGRGGEGGNGGNGPHSTGHLALSVDVPVQLHLSHRRRYTLMRFLASTREVA